MLQNCCQMFCLHITTDNQVEINNERTCIMKLYIWKIDLEYFLYVLYMQQSTRATSCLS